MSRWIASKPPIYVWDRDEWIRETDSKIFVANTSSKEWISEDEKIPFPPKSKILR